MIVIRINDDLRLGYELIVMEWLRRCPSFVHKGLGKIGKDMIRVYKSKLENGTSPTKYFISKKKVVKIRVKFLNTFSSFMERSSSQPFLKPRSRANKKKQGNGKEKRKKKLGNGTKQTNFSFH